MKMSKVLKTFVLMSMVSTSAFASDKVTLNLSPNDLLQIQNSLAALDGYHKIIKNNLGQDTDVTISYDLLPGARLTIAHDETVIQQTFVELRKAAQGLSPEDTAKLASTPQPIDLLTLEAKDLKIDTNPFAPTTLAGLSPICPSCSGVSLSSP